MSTYTHPLAAQGTATTGAGLLEDEALGAAGVEGVWLGGGVVDVEGVGLTLGKEGKGAAPVGPWCCGACRA